MKILRDALALLSIIASAVYIALCWSSLPSLIPSHFGLDGQPNRFAPKAILWIILAVSASIYILLTVVRRFPRLFNLPSPVGDPDRPRQEALGVELIASLRLEAAILFAYIVWSIIHISRHHAEGLGTAFLFIPIAVIAATTAFYLIRMKQPHPRP